MYVDRRTSGRVRGVSLSGRRRALSLSSLSFLTTYIYGGNYAIIIREDPLFLCGVLLHCLSRKRVDSRMSTCESVSVHVYPYFLVEKSHLKNHDGPGLHHRDLRRDPYAARLPPEALREGAGDAPRPPPEDLRRDERVQGVAPAGSLRVPQEPTKFFNRPRR